MDDYLLLFHGRWCLGRFNPYYIPRVSVLWRLYFFHRGCARKNKKYYILNFCIVTTGFMFI